MEIPFYLSTANIVRWERKERQKKNHVTNNSHRHYSNNINFWFIQTLYMLCWPLWPSHRFFVPRWSLKSIFVSSLFIYLSVPEQMEDEKDKRNAIICFIVANNSRSQKGKPRPSFGRRQTWQPTTPVLLPKLKYRSE